MVKKLLFLLCIFTLDSAYSQESSLKENIEYLSSDAMQGRENGSPELLECGKWIASQFSEFGLESPDFCENYLQKILLLRVQNVYKTLKLNQNTIKEEDFFTLGQFDRINIVEPTDFKLFVIGKEDDINNAFFEIKNFTSSYAVLVHPIHKRRFERFKRYFTRDNLALENPTKAYSLWVLTEENRVDDIHLISRNKVEKTEIYNVIGVLPSAKGDERKWIYSAHYDHIGIIAPVDGDSIANGANDDASGVASVIELAKKFTESEEKIDKTIWFVAFAGEELGLFGSKYLASQTNLSSVEAMINIELVGQTNIDLGAESAFISGYDLSFLPSDMSDNVDHEEFMFFPDPYPNLNLQSRSDNVPFAAYGIPAHTISTYSESDESYHTVHDDVDLLDFENIKSVINAIYTATLPLLNFEYDPGIIDYKTKNNR